jgi:molecular chaperone DnaK (HSP70)
MFYIGLDFGTYTTKVAILLKDKPKLLNLENLSDNDGFIYSFIDLESDEIGLPAYDKYKNGKGNVKYGFKLRMMEEEGKQLCIKFLSKIREKN